MQHFMYQPVRNQVASFDLGTLRNSILCILIFSPVLSSFPLRIIHTPYQYYVTIFLYKFNLFLKMEANKK